MVVAEGEEKRNFNREKERESIYQSIKIIRSDIYRFKDKVKQYENNPEYLMKLEELSENLLKKINDFKAKQMEIFDEVVNEEEKLSKEIEIFMENIEGFEKPITEKTQQAIKNLEAVQKFKATPQNQIMEKYAVLWDEEGNDANDDEEDNEEIEDDESEYDSQGEKIEKIKKPVEEDDDEYPKTKGALYEMEGDYMAHDDGELKNLHK